MTEIRTCWAISKDGERCGKRASHRGSHAITIEWEDEDCYTPKATPIPAMPPPPIAETAQADATVCVACGHRHSAGPCKCGCYEFIG